MEILQIDQLSKSYGRIKAIDRLSLTVNKGEVYGILGPNGSGKTTTLGTILGILHRDSGSYRWFEGQHDPKPLLQVGALLETPNFYPYLDAERNLDIIAHIKRIDDPNIDEVLELVNLAHRRKSSFRTYSFGMKQRLAIGAAMIGNPEVLIFDEPTNGLDPQGIAEVRETILRIADMGKTIIMASHILDEVEKVCSHAAIIKNGHLLAAGTVGAIINQDIMVDLISPDNERLLQILQQHLQLTLVDRQDTMITIQVTEDTDPAHINQIAFDNGLMLSHLVARKKSLEAEFLELTSQAS
ncbi:MAG: ATP-binding cassette domain-containing protein [Bacteroidota bacterium]